MMPRWELSVVFATESLGTQRWQRPGSSCWVQFHVAEPVYNFSLCPNGCCSWTLWAVTVVPGKRDTDPQNNRSSWLFIKILVCWGHPLVNLCVSAWDTSLPIQRGVLIHLFPRLPSFGFLIIFFPSCWLISQTVGHSLWISIVLYLWPFLLPNSMNI